MPDESSRPVVVCYHYPCPDGIYSALAAHLHLKSYPGKVRFYPLTVYTAHQPEELKLQGDETVYMLDIAGRPGFAAGLARLCHEVIVLDHHKTAMEDLGPDVNRPENLKVTFDMQRSGATIARDYFQPDLPKGVDEMIRIIEDGDLWRWKIPESKAFYAYLGSLKLEYDYNKNPAVFDELMRIDVEVAVTEGQLILQEENKRIETRLKKAFHLKIAGPACNWGCCLAVRGDGMQDHRSEMGNQLARRSLGEGLRGVSCVAYVEPAMNDPSQIKLSFRGIGDEDTTPITKSFGGGGHAKASSCVVPLAEFESWEFSGEQTGSDALDKVPSSKRPRMVESSGA